MPQIIAYADQYKVQTINFILSILENEFGYTNIERPDLYDIPNIYQQNGGNFWIAILNNKIIGTIAIQNYENGRGFLKRMYVKKELRKKGIGQELINILLKFAKNSGYKIIYTSTVEEFISARNFYNKNGFIEINNLPDDLDAPGDNIFLELKCAT